MTTISENHVVEMNYTLTNDAGVTLDSSEGRAPLAFIHGKENIIPGLEKEFTGKKVGDTFKATIPPEEAYGLKQEGMTQAVPKSEFGPDVDKIQLGTQFQVQTQNDQLMLVTAVEINDDHIVLDGNHPLAGQTLHFNVEVVSIREATKEELEKGHLRPETSCCDSEDSGCCD